MLGKLVLDRITKASGIAAARCEYLNGCIQYRVDAPIKADGNIPEPRWVDAGQLEVVGDGIVLNKSDNGGPSVSMPKGLGHP